VRSNEDFSRNYLRANSDGVYGPIAVGNINEFDDEKNGKTMIINLCFKTIRSGEKNASLSQPSDWKLKFSTGQFVNVQVENGYVRKIMAIHVKSLTSAVAKSIEEEGAKNESVALSKDVTVSAAISALQEN